MMSWCRSKTGRKGGKNRRRFPLSARLDVALDLSAVLIADQWTHLGGAVPQRPRPARATRFQGRSPACEVENARKLIAAPEFMKELIAQEDIRFHGNPVCAQNQHPGGDCLGGLIAATAAVVTPGSMLATNTPPGSTPRSVTRAPRRPRGRPSAQTSRANTLLSSPA